MDRLKTAIRSLTRSGLWLRKEAQRSIDTLARGPMFGVKVSILDGYIIRAVRTKDRANARIIDTPALVALPGRYVATPGQSNYTPTHTAVYEFPLGRDDLIYQREEPFDVQSALPSHKGAAPAAPALIGVEPAGLEIKNNNERTSSFPTPNGFVTVDTNVANRFGFDVYPYAYMRTTDPVLYDLNTYVLQTAYGVYTASADGWDTTVLEPLTGQPSVVVSDSILPPGVMGMCKRDNTPAYDPSASFLSPQALFDGAQLPWARACVVDPTDAGERQVFMASHCVVDMLGDNDRFGAKGVCFNLLRVGLDVTNQPPTVVAQYLLDMRDNTDPRTRPRPTFTGVPNQGYATNLAYPTMLARSTIPDGLGVKQIVYGVTLYQCAQTIPPDTTDDTVPFTNYNTVLLHRFVDAAVETTVLAPAIVAANVAQTGVRNDLSFPVGVDTTEGGVAVAVFYSSDSRWLLPGEVATQCSLNVYAIDGASNTLAFSGLINQRYPANVAESRFDCLRYIGNGKFLFTGTDQYTLLGSIFQGDLVAMIYDVNANTVAMVGTIDPTIRGGLVSSNQRYMGHIACPVKELQVDGEITRKATVIVTVGPLGFIDGTSGAESGRTYISYDSGETWQQIASYGSPAGAHYCGTILGAGLRPL